MKLFYDTELIERGPEHPLVLLALGVVTEDGRELFAANSDADMAAAPPWVRENVIPYLPPAGSPAWMTRTEIARRLRDLVGDATPEWWASWGAYDHVALSQLFGTMDELPSGWPFFTHEIQQWWEALGRPALPPDPADVHHALADARWVRDAYLALRAAALERIDAVIVATGCTDAARAVEQLRPLLDPWPPAGP